jgi:hypothetical protein
VLKETNMIRVVLFTTMLGLLVAGESQAVTDQACEQAAAETEKAANLKMNADTAKEVIDCAGDAACRKAATERQKPVLRALQKQAIDAHLNCQETAAAQARMEKAAEQCLNSPPAAGSSQERVCQNVVKEWNGVTTAAKENLKPKSHLDGKGFDPNPPAPTSSKPNTTTRTGPQTGSNTGGNTTGRTQQRTIQKPLPDVPGTTIKPAPTVQHSDPVPPRPQQTLTYPPYQGYGGPSSSNQ